MAALVPDRIRTGGLHLPGSFGWSHHPGVIAVQVKEQHPAREPGASAVSIIEACGTTVVVRDWPRNCEVVLLLGVGPKILEASAA